MQRLDVLTLSFYWLHYPLSILSYETNRTQCDCASLSHDLYMHAHHPKINCSGCATCHSLLSVKLRHLDPHIAPGPTPILLVCTAANDIVL
jgi:hypothetical protein